MTPFEAVYGRPPPALVPYQLHKATNDGVDNYLRSRDTIIRDLRLHLARAQNRMKVQADKKRREKEYTIGDRVYLKLQPYRQSSLAERRFHKLRHKYYGPYTVVERIGPVAYRLDLPDDAKIHNVFHISQLKDGNSVPTTVAPSLPPFSTEGELQFKPSRVLKRRTIRARGQNHQQVLVAWEGLPDSEATWEDYEAFHDTFHLEDKLALKGGGNDSTRPSRSKGQDGRGQTMEQPASASQHKEQQAQPRRGAVGREQGAERPAQPAAEASWPRTRAQARAERAAAGGHAQAGACQG
jgi:ribosomal protein L21E